MSALALALIKLAAVAAPLFLAAWAAQVYPSRRLVLLALVPGIDEGGGAEDLEVAAGLAEGVGAHWSCSQTAMARRMPLARPSTRTARGCPMGPSVP